MHKFSRGLIFIGAPWSVCTKVACCKNWRSVSGHNGGTQTV